MLDSIQISPDVFDENNTGKIKQIQYLHKKNIVFEKLLELIKPIGNELLGNDSWTVLNVQLFEKHPQISKPTRAHQDNAYFQQTPPTPLTIWIGLDSIDESNGCVYYANQENQENPALSETLEHSRYNENTTFRTRSGVPGLSLCLPNHPEHLDIPVPVVPGDILVHNSNTIHRAGKNNTINKRRRAIGIPLIPSNCTLDVKLAEQHKKRLEQDIQLQQKSNPVLFSELTKIKLDQK